LQEANNIEYASYLYLRNKPLLSNLSFDLTPQEETALKGFKGELVDPKTVKDIINKRPVKGVGATSNIYKLSGLYLASKCELKNVYLSKFRESDLKQKYFLALIEPEFKKDLISELNKLTVSNQINILKKIFHLKLEIKERDLTEAISEFVKNDIRLQEILILEDLEKALLSVKYIEYNAEELVRNILKNFSNAIKKIIMGRRKDHDDFRIEDEYDVQDILYVILKSVFPSLRDEDPIPKVGAKSTKIDLILRNEEILIEVKMLKKKDKNETHLIEELKVDFESYHECKWLKKLFCFVYDPYKKTKDIANINDLNGHRKKNEHEYCVEVILAN
jgi:hypothetical protein